MSTAVDELKNVLAGLAVEERAELACFLISSIDQDGAADAEAA